MNHLHCIASLLTAGLLAACTAPAGAPITAAAAPTIAQQELKVIIFPGGFNWPIWVGQEQGFFARQALDVKTINTPNSTFQLTGLIKGDFDIAMTALDNIIAYREGQGAPGADGSDLVAVMGADNGFLRLASTSDVRNIAELKGKQLSVDSLTTGYAFVLLEVMSRNGLQLNRDYTTVSAGGVLQRYNDLVQKKHAATMLIAPFDVMAKAQGANVLVDASEALGNYQGLVAGVRKSWANANPRAVTAYIKGYQESLNWLYQPANKPAALALFMKNVPNSTLQAAETSYGILLDAKSGFEKTARINLEGAKTVVALREKYGQPAKKLQAAAAYYDGRFFEAAR
jgi:ABC-type nitrate/sulfonate/bicarbonate transport system substrate-binding protein